MPGKFFSSATDIAQEINKHFASIGPKMAESVTSIDPSTTKELTKYKIRSGLKAHSF